MIAQELEVSLHMAFVDARQKRHEFITVEHLLLALLDNPSAAVTLRASGGNIEHLPAIRQVGIIADGESLQTKRLFLTFQQGEQGLRPIENAM